MLRITRVVLASQDTTLQLDGSVTGQWVELLRNTSELFLDEGSKLTIDLKNVVFIDCSGVALLRSLIRRGVGHVNAPLFVAQQIRQCNDAQVDTRTGEG